MLDLTSLDSPPDEILGTPRGAVPCRAPLSAFIIRGQPRSEFDGPEWDAFCADIAARGIMQPIVVHVIPEGLLIKMGHRRFMAAEAAGHHDAPYVATEDVRHLDDYAQVAENNQRTPLQPLELARFIHNKVTGGEKKRAVAEKIGIDPSAVTHLLSLIDAPDLIMELYYSRRCRAPHVLYELRRLLEAVSDTPDKAALIEETCKTADDVDRALVRQLQGQLIAPASIAAADAPADASAGLGQTTDAAGGEGHEQAATAVDTKKKKKPKKEDDPATIKRPVLYGAHEGRLVALLLHRRPTDGLIQVRLEDGGEVIEVPIGEITLTQLTDGNTK